ncbi:hypothetical protein [Streptomyces sp. NBC_01483]|uniref:hypothetical protein n=1 Tax=Streptomyces sp. NBC_01483 TaxID=2903883 RepID=UPI002E3248E0|nr:hypothetical protein [Streptomyces sp. NBC_01483]
MVVVFLGAVVFFAVVVLAAADFFAVGLRGDGFLEAASFVTVFQPVAQPIQLKSA